MKSFKSYAYMIFEEEDGQAKTGHLKHLTHAEDEHIHNGMEGAEHAYNLLHDVHKQMTGQGGESTKTTVKYDGSPSIVFGIHPETGAPFVASKSAFNKNPKINYTPEDIERNHGHAPGLVEKLKAALEHLPKILPKEGGVYQGDLMYTKPDIQSDGDKRSFTPNLITYSTSRNSPAGQKMDKAKIGVVVHTKYEGNNLEDMNATPNVDHSKFGEHPDVHLINPEIHTTPSEYSDKLQKQFHGHMAKAREAAHGLKPEDFKAIEGHETNLESHINDTIKREDRPSVSGYISHLEGKRDKEAAKLKSEAGRSKTTDRYNALIDHVKRNADSFNKVLAFHTHIQNAKNALVHGIGNPTEFEHSINGEPTSPEGFVSVRNGKMSKLNDRGEFNRKNFLARTR
jgi:hypothetical protein